MARGCWEEQDLRMVVSLGAKILSVHDAKKTKRLRMPRSRPRTRRTMWSGGWRRIMKARRARASEARRRLRPLLRLRRP